MGNYGSTYTYRIPTTYSSGSSVTFGRVPEKRKRVDRMEILQTAAEIGVVISVIYLLVSVRSLWSKVDRIEKSVYPALRNRRSK